MLLGILAPVAVCGAESPQAVGDAAAVPYRIEEVSLGLIPSRFVGAINSTDGCHVAFVVVKGGKRFVVLDGQAGPAYDGIRNLVFSPDGKRVAYRAQKAGKFLVVIDGQPVPDYDGVLSGPVFRPDGTLEYLAGKAGTLFRVKHVPVEK